MFNQERPHFQQQLKGLEEDFLDLTQLVTEAFEQAMYALRLGSFYTAERVIARDKFINARRYELEDSVLHLLTLQQPVVARDLRFVASMIIFANELERMGDYAKGIATIAQELHQQAPLSEVELALVARLEEMAQQGLQMLKAASVAFVTKDMEAARQTAQADQHLDELYNQTILQMLELVIEQRQTLNRVMKLNWAAHNLERLGDRVVNLCERVVFIESGLLADF
jgi:phosphate transport system protein